MDTVAIIINISDQMQLHSNGLSGTWIVPPKTAKDEFGMLVVYPQGEPQDQGDNRSKVQTVEAMDLAKSIIGFGSDAGSKEKWGLVLCAAQPDIPRTLLAAIREEREFLNDNPPDVKTRIDKKSGAVGLVNIESSDIGAQKVKLSYAVRDLRLEFEESCRKLVTKKEIAFGKKNQQEEDQKKVAEGDRMWAGPEAGRGNINELNTRACARLGQSRPWAYVPEQLVDCPGCGAKIKENILACPHCTGWLDEGIEELRVMPPKERKRAMYPSQDSDAVATSGKKA